MVVSVKEMAYGDDQILTEEMEVNVAFGISGDEELDPDIGSLKAYKVYWGDERKVEKEEVKVRRCKAGDFWLRPDGSMIDELLFN